MEATGGDAMGVGGAENWAIDGEGREAKAGYVIDDATPFISDWEGPIGGEATFDKEQGQH